MKVSKKENKIPYSTRLKPSVIEKIKFQASKDNVSEVLVIEHLVETNIKIDSK